MFSSAAAQYGLMQGPSTDDRLDPEKATRAAAKHLHDLYAMFGDWYLAMAAYNCGPGCVQRAVERTGYADFWELRRLNVLPHETANYVPLIVALTIMAKNPKDYDLENLDTDRPVEYETMDLDTPTSLALIADAADRPVSEIQDLNPALLKSAAPAGYQMRVPKGTLAAVIVRLWIWCRPIIGQTGEFTAWCREKHWPRLPTAIRTPVAALTSANQRAALGAAGDAPVAGDLLVVPAASRLSRGNRTEWRGSLSRQALAQDSGSAQDSPSPVPRRKAHASAYHTGKPGLQAPRLG